MIRKATFTLVFICSFQNLFSQESLFDETGDLNDSLIVNLASYLPPLSVMVDTAIAHAPQIEYFLHRQKMYEYEESMVRNEWLENISITGSYSNGTNVLDGLNVGGINYGVNLRIPIGSVLTIPSRTKMAHEASLAEAAKRKEQEQLIQKAVEETFRDLFRLKEILETVTEAKESGKFIYEEAEFRYVRGEVSLGILGQQADLKTKWGVNYIDAKAEFFNTYKYLEMLVGVPFSKFNLED